MQYCINALLKNNNEIMQYCIINNDIALIMHYCALLQMPNCSSDQVWWNGTKEKSFNSVSKNFFNFSASKTEWWQNFHPTFIECVVHGKKMTSE